MPISAKTQQALTEISALIAQHLVSTAFDRLIALIANLPSRELLVAADEIRPLIGRFLKQKRRDLALALDRRIYLLSSVKIASNSVSPYITNPVSPSATGQPVSERVAHVLKTLAEEFIFKWTPQYRDSLRQIFTWALSDLPKSGQLDAEVKAIGGAFGAHARRIYDQGFRFQVERGLKRDVAEEKSVNGLQKFLDLIVSIYLDKCDEIEDAQSAEVLWAIASASICAVAHGYGSVSFGPIHGWELMSKNLRVWVPPLGFCRGTDLQVLFEEFPAPVIDEDLRLTLTSAALAIERVAHGFHNRDVLLPRMSRVAPAAQPRLDITLSAKRGDLNRELLITCFVAEPVRFAQPIQASVVLNSAVIIGRFVPDLQMRIEQGEFETVVDGSNTTIDREGIEHLSERVFARLDAHLADRAGFSAPDEVPRNFARDFPLEDPDFRRQFMVERHSVKRLLQQLEGSIGIHLWCSVRRSGKTTAVLELADAGGSSLLAMQTMDRQPRRPIQNIFWRRVKEAFELGKELDENFFNEVVKECVLAASTTGNLNSRIVFILDEYETLFGLINGYVKENSTLKTRIALPLLSQMTDFSANNLIVFMGQRPDAFQILASQNQLSPHVRQHQFPLFHHINDAPETEFTLFLKHVLSDKLPFESSFANAVFEETGGHPYLTVNLMVDFCDWLIATKHRLSSGVLAGRHFERFEQDQLVSTMLKRSPHYDFFHSLIAEYLSEQSRADEPWLFAIAKLLQALAPKRKFTMSVDSFERHATPMGSAARMTPARLLMTGCQANFFQDKKGSVTPGVRLLARIASASTPHIN